jgi:RNA polymerase sigma-70 factor (ECF subfamily)
MAQPPSQTDAELVRLAQDGSLDAFTALYERHLPAVYNRVRYTVPELDVDDVTQEVFIAVMKSLKSFKGQAQFTTWLRTLTNRQIADYYRRRNAASQPVLAEAGNQDPIEVYSSRISTNMTALDDTIFIRQALYKLPEKYQEILLLRFAEDLQFNEIAVLQKQSLEATKSLFRRAVATLQKQLEEINV